MFINLIISLLIVTTSCFTSTADLGSTGGYSLEGTLTETSTDVYSFDIKFTFPSTIMGIDKFIGLSWIETGQSDFTLTTDTDHLDVFGYSTIWRSPCNSISDLESRYYLSGTATFTSSNGNFNTSGRMNFQDSFIITNTSDISSDPSAPTITFHFTDIGTISLASDYKLPNKNQGFYYKCYSIFNWDSLPYALQSSNVANAFSSSSSAITDAYLGMSLSSSSSPSVPSSGSSSSGDVVR